ncbi:hypothetical protein [Streptomyces goshikiensis]|uniref:hypothetical protein n=1 Tax=Streptomyces goshikiensis TaxID=1942 RepID=UPI0036A90419
MLAEYASLDEECAVRASTLYGQILLTTGTAERPGIEISHAAGGAFGKVVIGIGGADGS